MMIAIDGPAAAGKGTLARRIADTLALRTWTQVHFTGQRPRRFWIMVLIRTMPQHVQMRR